MHTASATASLADLGSLELQVENITLSFDELPWSHPRLHGLMASRYPLLVPPPHHSIQALLGPLEFPNRPVKDVVVLESLLANKLTEHLSEVLIVRLILIAQIIDIIHIVLELS